MSQSRNTARGTKRRIDEEPIMTKKTATYETIHETTDAQTKKRCNEETALEPVTEVIPLVYEGRAKSSVTNRLPLFYPRYILKCFTALEWCVEYLTISVYFVQIAIQLTELFQTEIDAVIYTDQFTCYSGTWTKRLKFVAIFKCRIRLNIDLKQVFNEMCDIYRPQIISMRTVCRWVKAFKAGKFSVEDDIRPGRLNTSVTKANIAAVKIVVEQDARLSVKEIASCTGIS